MTKEKNLIYKSGIRYYTPKYPYRILVELDKGEIIISNYSVNDKAITHAIGIKKGDLERILKNSKK